MRARRKKKLNNNTISDLVVAAAAAKCILNEKGAFFNNILFIYLNVLRSVAYLRGGDYIGASVSLPFDVLFGYKSYEVKGKVRFMQFQKMVLIKICIIILRRDYYGYDIY